MIDKGINIDTLLSISTPIYLSTTVIIVSSKKKPYLAGCIASLLNSGVYQ